jgi:hypothetical protein
MNRLLRALTNWRCSDCDTWNDDTDKVCHTCS